MSEDSTSSPERERRCAFLEQSLRVPLLLDGRRVHVAGIGRKRASLWPLLNDFADSHGGFNYDHTERIETEWEIVEQALNNSRVLEPHQITRETGPWMQFREEHVFGYLAEGCIWRFGSVVDNATFCRLTFYHGLPPHWIAWHQGTTSSWPHLLDKYPLLTMLDRQRLTGQPEEGDSAGLQDPTPLLEHYATRSQAAKVLRVLPCTISDANAYVTRLHRHHDAVTGALYALCVVDSAGLVRGVALMGRPVARMLDVGEEGEMKRRVVEVLRVATDGSRNACSMLYGAARRLAKEAGFEQVITYTLASEPGTSLRAAGWTRVAFVKGRQWSCKARERQDRPISAEDKVRWACSLNSPRSFKQIVFPMEKKGD